MPGEISSNQPSAYSNTRSGRSSNTPQNYGWEVEPIPTLNEDALANPFEYTESRDIAQEAPPVSNRVPQSVMEEFSKAMLAGGTPIYNKNRIYFDDIKVDGPDGELITFAFGDILNAGGLTDKRVIILGFKPADDMAVIGAPDESGIIVEKRLVPYRELVLYKIVGNL